MENEEGIAGYNAVCYLIARPELSRSHGKSLQKSEGG